jgi:hypothetical protein
MQLTVRKLLQTSGPGYVVKYTADFDTAPSLEPVSASVANTVPVDADPELVEMARTFITESFSQVLGARGLSATVVIRDLVIHDVDFAEFAFRKFTTSALEELLESSA